MGKFPVLAPEPLAWAGAQFVPSGLGAHDVRLANIHIAALGAPARGTLRDGQRRQGAAFVSNARLGLFDWATDWQFYWEPK